MPKRQVPDPEQRAELVQKANELIKLCRELMPGGSTRPGQKLPQEVKRDRLSEEAKRVLPEDLDPVTAQRIASTQGPQLVRWASDPETEGRPIPDGQTKIMQLIDLL